MVRKCIEPLLRRLVRRFQVVRDLVDRLADPRVSGSHHLDDKVSPLGKTIRQRRRRLCAQMLQSVPKESH
jgi:hypothetical protein